MKEPRNSGAFFLTGCASGIGQHLTAKLLERGERVFATDVNLPALEGYAAAQHWPPDRLRTAALDVRDADTWDSVFAQAVEAFGRIGVAMNIAGVLLPNWVLDVPRDEIHAQMDINVKGVIFGTQIAARHMIAQGGGHIVNIASLSGIGPVPGMAVYSASKFAVRAFSLIANYELRRSGVCVTAVCPDGVNTPLADLCRRVKAGALLFSARRMLTVEDVAHVVLGRVLNKRPAEVVFPWSRAWLMRFGSMFPSLMSVAVPPLWRRARANQPHLGKKKD